MSKAQLDETLVEVAEEWLQEKHASLWPSLQDGDLNDPRERRRLAEWFVKQASDFDQFFYETMRLRHKRHQEEVRKNLPA